MSLRAMNGLDGAREDAIATGTTEATPEEELARYWEAQDRLAEMAPAFGVTGPWTSFSPAECRVIEMSLDALPLARVLVGLQVPPHDVGAEEDLRRKAQRGAAR